MRDKSKNKGTSRFKFDLPPRPRIDLTKNIERIEHAFQPETLKAICEMREDDFAEVYGMTVTPVKQKAPADFYAFRDNGSDVLAVAHLDTVVRHHQRTANFVDTEAGPVVFSGALDDRLGAYIILELLPALGVTYDILLTVGEEEGRSTAAFFEAPKDYNWMIEFDRGGSDVVMYEYEDDDTLDLVRDSGARVGSGSFSDICYLDHLGRKGFNWGVGYQDYHGPRGHAFLDDTFAMVARFLNFHEANAETLLPHYAMPTFSHRWPRWWEDDDDAVFLGKVLDNEEGSEEPETWQEMYDAVQALEAAEAEAEQTWEQEFDGTPGIGSIEAEPA